MRSVWYCLSQPYGAAANELIDVVSVSAVFDQPTAVCFIGDGVWQLFDESDEPLVKNTTKYLSALPSFGLTNFYVERETLYQFNLLARFRDAQEQDPDSFLRHVKIKDRSVLRNLMRNYDCVVTD